MAEALRVDLAQIGEPFDYRSDAAKRVTRHSEQAATERP